MTADVTRAASRSHLLPAVHTSREHNNNKNSCCGSSKQETCLTLVSFGMPNPRWLLPPAPTMLSPFRRGIRVGGGSGGSVVAVVDTTADADSTGAVAASLRGPRLQQQLRAATDTGTSTNSLVVNNLSSGRTREPECCLTSCLSNRGSNIWARSFPPSAVLDCWVPIA